MAGDTATIIAFKYDSSERINLMAKTMYAVKFKYDQPDLARVTIARETAKTVIISECENLLGSQYFGRRTHKDTTVLLPDAESAWDWLIERVKQRAEALRDQADKVEALVPELEQARQEV